MADLRLIVNGRAYGGWKEIQVTRGIASIAGSFTLSVSERWNGQEEPWPIVEEDECEVQIDGETLITGYVDRRELAYAAQTHTLTIAGRDRTGDLVDCSAVLDTWEFLSVPVLRIVERVARPFGIAVSMEGGVTVPKPPVKFTVNPGDSAHEVIDRACRLAGLLPRSDGRGGLILGRAGSARTTTALVEGQNILSARASIDASHRFRRYLVSGQHPGSEEFFGEAAAAVQAEARDENVRRSARVLMVRAEGNATPEYAQQRANWEAAVRAARAGTVRIEVQGWTQGDGSLWPVNARVQLRSPFLGIDGEMLITEATYRLSEASGTQTELTLMRPDAFLPEPVLPEFTDPWSIADDD